MSYIDDSLSDGETVLGRFGLHWTAWLLAAAWFFLGIAAVAVSLAMGAPAGAWLAVIFFIPGAREAVKLACLEMGVTNKRVVHKTGVIGRQTDEMKLASIETVEIDQGVLGRVMDYGTVRVTGKGVSGMAFAHVADPMAVKRQIESVSNPAS